MNDVVAFLGIQSWKPYLTLVALPPIPFLLLLIVGARLIAPRRGLGWCLVLASAAGVWLSCCNGVALLMNDVILHPPPPLGRQQIADLKAEVEARSPIAVVVLGGGRELLAPEYGVSNLTPQSAERLRYGVWLSRQVGAPLAFAGGIGWSQPDDISEAEVASRIASEEFNRPVKWMDTRSRDTRENAAYMMSILKPAGVRKILLVTHGWHMPRAVKDFNIAASASGAAMTIVPAPMGLSRRADNVQFDWLPTPDGFTKVRNVWREVLAKMLGA